MAASAWEFYNSFKEDMGDGTIDLDTQNFWVSLHTSAANVDDNTLSSFGSCDNEIADGNGYSTSGKVLSAVTWAAGASAGETRFDATARIWTASGGSIANIKYAVLRNSAGNLVARSQLSTAQFSVTTGNTLTITPSANGIFELN